MAEMLEVYNLHDDLVSIEERSKFYREANEEFKKSGKITRKVKSIRLILLNTGGRIYLQKRSASKEHNAGLYDKTIGGHVLAGHTWFLTVIKECHEELGFPAVVLTDEEFRSALKSTDIGIIGLFRKVGYEPDFQSVRKMKNGEMIQPFMTTFYVGYYDGAIRFADGESSGVEVFSPKELEAEIRKHPERYTEDLKFMVRKFRSFLVPLAAIK